MKKFKVIFYSDIKFNNLYYKGTNLYYILDGISYLVKFNVEGNINLYIVD